MLTPTDFVYWAASLALIVHAVHVPRIPSLWEQQMQKYMPMYVPKHLFFLVWLFILVFLAGFGAVFFQNTPSDSLYDATFILYFITIGLMLWWNHLFTEPVCFYAVGPVAFLILGCEVAMLVLAIEYGDTRAWVMAFIAVAIAGGLIVFIYSMIATVKLGPKFKVMRDEVARMTGNYIELASGGKGITSMKRY